VNPYYSRLWHLSRLEQKPSFNETWISDNTCTGHNEYLPYVYDNFEWPHCDVSESDCGCALSVLGYTETNPLEKKMLQVSEVCIGPGEVVDGHA